MDTKGSFYIGRFFDAQKGKSTDRPVLYDLDDLTTHAVVVGMTGSGKTGLCIDLLEEAALNGIPALMIDPKGDITNTLLHFPNLLPQDFQPWINPDLARREGKTIEQAAVETATLWQNGLRDWGIEPDRLLALKNAAQFAIFTPGSDAGIPVSILSSLKAPPIPWEGNRELLRETISGTVTALLGLVGLTDIDPVRSREHILLSNIFEHAWSKGADLDLGELILQTQSPPFPKLGVLDVNSFFPQKDRFELAMLLNNILASPAFQAWIEGHPLDIPSLLYTPDGRPRHSVFYIAHLPEAERMFFVTLLFSAVESWMRSQSGTSTLRAIVYFDEIFGYLPPIANPPSKQTMLRMLKQARAFGVGLVLATQNPVDVDYKALSNAGTWFIGKLQTDQDKQRLLDGLEGAMTGGLNRSAYDRLISAIGKRVFLLHNVHNSPSEMGQLLQTRWAMNYLAGPLARNQIPPLNQLAGATQPAAAYPSAAQGAPAAQQVSPTTPKATTPAVAPAAPARPEAKAAGSGLGSTTRPALPASVTEYFLPNNLTFTQAFKAAGEQYPQDAQSQGILYRPVVLGQTRVRFLNRKYNLDYELLRTVLISEPDRRGMVRWENYPSPSLEPAKLEEYPAPGARFVSLETPLTDARLVTAMEKDFLDWGYRTSQVAVRVNEALAVYAGPNISQAEFRQMCTDAAREGRDAESKKACATYDRKIEVLQGKLTREERELSQDESELSQRKMEELGTHAENVLSLFAKRKSSRRISSSLTKRRQTADAKADVEESIKAIAEMKQQIAALEKEKAQILEEVNERWSEMINQSSELSLTPLKKDVLLDFFGVAWFPYYIVQTSGRTIELPAYGSV